MYKIYQLDLVTPGTSPLEANSLKQIRHSPNSRMKACLRPQRQQRRTIRVENFGFSMDLCDLIICAFVAICVYFLFFLKGKPMCFNKAKV
jgi:hypothetical protein